MPGYEGISLGLGKTINCEYPNIAVPRCPPEGFSQSPRRVLSVPPEGSLSPPEGFSQSPRRVLSVPLKGSLSPPGGFSQYPGGFFQSSRSVLSVPPESSLSPLGAFSHNSSVERYFLSLFRIFVYTVLLFFYESDYSPYTCGGIYPAITTPRMTSLAPLRHH